MREVHEPATTTQEDYQKGLECLKNQNYKDARFYLTKSANQQHPAACLTIIILYEAGINMIIDDEQREDYETCVCKNFSWFEEEHHKLNSADTALNFAHLYQNGFGIIQDYKKSADLYRLSDKLGNTDAPYYLGFLYEKGFGLERNMEAAAKYYSLAANLGNMLAQHKIAFFYEFGMGGETQCAQTALKYYQLAANQGYEESKERFDELLEMPERMIKAKKYSAIYDLISTIKKGEARDEDVLSSLPTSPTNKYRASCYNDDFIYFMYSASEHNYPKTLNWLLHNADTLAGKGDMNIDTLGCVFWGPVPRIVEKYATLHQAFVLFHKNNFEKLFILECLGLPQDIRNIILTKMAANYFPANNIRLSLQNYSTLIITSISLYSRTLFLNQIRLFLIETEKEFFSVSISSYFSASQFQGFLNELRTRIEHPKLNIAEKEYHVKGIISLFLTQFHSQKDLKESDWRIIKLIIKFELIHEAVLENRYNIIHSDSSEDSINPSPTLPPEKSIISNLSNSMSNFFSNVHTTLSATISPVIEHAPEQPKEGTMKHT